MNISKDIGNKSLHKDEYNAEGEGDEEECEKEYNKLFYRDIFDFFDWNNSNTIPTSVSINPQPIFIVTFKIPSKLVPENLYPSEFY